MPTTMTPTTPLPLPKFIAYDDWLKGTAITLLPRDAVLKALDEQLQLYERNPTGFRFFEVQAKLDAWKARRGPGDAWKKDPRNSNNLFTRLDQQTRGLGDTDVALGAQDFMTPALINSRLGVLYLFANTSVEDSIFQVVLEGAFDITTAGLGTAPTSNTAASQASDALDGLKKPTGFVAGKVESQIRQRTGKQAGKQTVSAAQLSSAPPANPPTDSALRRLYEAIRAKIEEAASKLWEMIREKIVEIRKDPGGTALDVLPGLIRKLVNFLCGKLFAAAAPFIGAGLDLAKGIANTIDASITRYREWVAGRDVQILTGHPGTIVEAIRRTMSMSIGEGVYDTLKGAASLGIQIASQGAASIVSAVVSIVETLAKTIWKVVEIVRMKMFFTQAHTHWEARFQRDALHMQPIAFNAWFKRYAVPIPALSVLALNSGICGDKMHFLSMFKDNGAVIEQAEFAAGCRYVDGLKVWGSGYLKDAGFGFSSEDKVVQGLLKLARNHTEEKSTGAKVWQATLGFLNG
jgi:hypothetical protein